MDKSSVRTSCSTRRMEVGEFGSLPHASEADEDLDNAFLISTGILLGVPKLFIVRVEGVSLQ